MSNNRIGQADQLPISLKALAHPHRLTIVKLLTESSKTGEVRCPAGGEDACVCHLAKKLGISPSTTSHHLKELRQAGLVLVERRGQRIECQVNLELIRELGDFFAEMAATQTLAESA